MGELESLCAWLLHRFGPDSPEGREATARLKSPAHVTGVTVHHKTSHINREVETHTTDPRGGRWYWFVGQTREEGWTHEYDVEEAH